MAVQKIGVRVQYIDADTVKYVSGTFSNNGVFIPDYGNASAESLAALAEGIQDLIDGEFPDNLTPV